MLTAYTAQAVINLNLQFDGDVTTGGTGTFSLVADYTPNGSGQVQGVFNTSLELRAISSPFPDSSTLQLVTTSLSGSMLYNGSSYSPSSFEFDFIQDNFLGPDAIFTIRINGPSSFGFPPQNVVANYTGTFEIDFAFGTIPPQSVAGNFENTFAGESATVTAVPEPSVYAAALGMMACALALVRRRYGVRCS
ncbi:MAG: hypothetical protein AAGF10_00670 [Verrucomicrobiota bacterium]